MTPVKYECDANNLTSTLTGSKILLTEKLTNRALVTPTPGLQGIFMPTTGSHSNYWHAGYIYNIISSATLTQPLDFKRCIKHETTGTQDPIAGLMQERRISSALAMELRLS